MANIIIGTAGHVDHGKTSLVIALTGKDTDRLREEKERGISIELGFAPLKLPGGALAGIIDVPGHERFIKNMLAGVGAIDLVLFIIAADEGVMPQTQEHLDIINLLQIPQGIVVITKTDLVDKEWLELVKEEIKPVLKGTVLENAPMIEVSSVTRAGIDELISIVEGMIQQIKPKSGFGQVRLPIDRVFTITGFGTVVTGTLISGTIKLGDELNIYPQEFKTKVRSIQVHGNKVKEAIAGHRVAVNITDVELSDVERGNVLGTVASLTPSFRLDTWFSLLSSAPKAITNRIRIRLYLGSTEVFGRLILLDREELEPGDSCFVQINLETPLVAVKNDRFVVRTYSPMITVGGGIIIDPYPPKHKRFNRGTLEALEVKRKGTPEEIVNNYLLVQKGLITKEQIVKDLNIEVKLVEDTLILLQEKDCVKVLKMGNVQYLLSAVGYERWKKDLVEVLSDFHIKNPLKNGMGKEEIRTKKFQDINNKVFTNLLAAFQAEEVIKINEQWVALHDFEITLSPEEQKLVQTIEKAYLIDLYKPPEWKNIIQENRITEDKAEVLLQYFLDEGILIKLDNILFHSQGIEKAKALIIDFLNNQETIEIGQARDIFDSSRKFVLPILEYFDRQKVTRRVGDKRVLFNSQIKG